MEHQLTEKDLHCMARALQSENLGNDIKCLYCKYAFQCCEEFDATKKAPFLGMWDRLGKITGVKIRLCDPEDSPGDLLAGSWIESCPELSEQFTGLSFEEQLDILHSPDILQYRDKCCPEN